LSQFSQECCQPPLEVAESVQQPISEFFTGIAEVPT
jgi:hypothetical protein